MRRCVRRALLLSRNAARLNAQIPLIAAPRTRTLGPLRGPWGLRRGSVAARCGAAISSAHVPRAPAALRQQVPDPPPHRPGRQVLRHERRPALRRHDRPLQRESLGAALPPRTPQAARSLSRRDARTPRTHLTLPCCPRRSPWTPRPRPPSLSLASSALLT